MSAVILLVGAAATGHVSGADHVRARLVAESSALQPGGAAMVGVLFEIDPGWHIYWANPGDSGLATEVLFGLPDGYSVGELQWPLPVEFTQPGNLVGYGYEGTVLLAAEVRRPEAGSDDRVPVTASASWLACNDVCVLGSAKLEGLLAAAADDGSFDGWSESLPQFDPPFTVTTTGGVAAGSRRGNLSLWIHWPDQPGNVEFFPDGADRLKIAVAKVQTRGRLTRIDLDLSLIGVQGGDAPVLRSVVTAAGDTRVRRGWWIDVPLQNDHGTTME